MGNAAGSLSSRQGGVKAMAGQPSLRQQQRVSTALDVTVTGKTGESLVCRVADLSRAGMSIECDHRRTNALVSDRFMLAPKIPAPVNVSFAISFANTGPVPIEAVCNIIYIRRVSHKVFHLGLQFVEFSDNGQDSVARYVSQSLNG